MTNMKIRKIIKGIEFTDEQSDDGWWSTSVGADFGTRKLKAVLKGVDTLVEQNKKLVEDNKFLLRIAQSPVITNADTERMNQLLSEIKGEE